MIEFNTELTILGVNIRHKAEKRLQENKDNTRRDPEVYETLREIEGMRSEGKLLDAISHDRIAYRQCVALEIAEMF